MKTPKPKRQANKTSFKVGGPNPHAYKKRDSSDDVPTGPALLTHLASQGVRDDDLRRVLGVHRADWLEYKSANPEVQDAIDAGRAKMHDSLVAVLYKNAKRGQLVPALFLLKSVFQYREADPVDRDEGNRVVIVMPGAEKRPFIEGDTIPNDDEPIPGLTVVDVPKPTPHQSNGAAPPSGLEPQRPANPPSRPQTRDERAIVQAFEHKMGMRTNRNSFDSEAAYRRYTRRR